MRSFSSDPFLWIHLAGLAALPLFLELCAIALAIGDPLFPLGLELFFVAALGILPILWMQWSRPFYIFSILVVAMKPEQLSADRRSILSLFQRPRNRAIALLVPLLLLPLLWLLYRWAPVATGIAAQFPQWRILGLLLAAFAFLGCNLFLQVPASVFGVMLTDESTFAATPTLSPDQIRQNFTILGLKVNRILPDKDQPVELASTESASPTVSPPAPDSLETTPPETEASD
jgi:hypothetical protein